MKMKNKLYHLSTCSTCKRIIKALGDNAEPFDMQDIKTQKITAEQLEEMKVLAGSYEALFSRRSQQYAAMGLKDKTLSEQDYRDLILEEYTFLKRPVAIVGKEIFVGNSADNIAALQEKLAQ
jgi:arsenate reductase